MQYVVLDLEWNQEMNPKSPVYLRLPFRLRGEIIQIGAVKLDSNMAPGGEFSVFIKPKYFRRVHYKVKKLTGLDKRTLNDGLSFKQAFDELRLWCGGTASFLTWGFDDQSIMEQNIILYDLDSSWIGDWINLQVIYNTRLGLGRNQPALSAAMDNFGIEQTRVAHNALGDAYNTALIASRLGLGDAIADYNLLSLYAGQLHENNKTHELIPLERRISREYSSLSEAFSDQDLTSAKCPVCGGELLNSHWVNQGNRRYMTIARCDCSNKYLLRLKFRVNEFERWVATRIVYEASEAIVEYYNKKASNSAGKRRAGASKN